MRPSRWRWRDRRGWSWRWDSWTGDGSGRGMRLTCDSQVTIDQVDRASPESASPTIGPMPATRSRVSASPASPLAAALERVGDRWSLLVVEALLDGPRRYNDLLESLDGIAPNILADRLRRLERERLVVARPYSERPPRMDYALAADGRDLAGALRLLADWGARRAQAGTGERKS